MRLWTRQTGVAVIDLVTALSVVGILGAVSIPTRISKTRAHADVTRPAVDASGDPCLYLDTALTAIPTSTTTTAPIRLCQRNAMGVVKATVSTTAIPATRP